MTAAQLLQHAELLHSQPDVATAIARLAGEISQELAQSNPLVICVMGGAVVFAGMLLPLLPFPLTFDFVQVSRYRNQTVGDTLEWKVAPDDRVRGRVVLLVDDILDEGHTLHAIHERCLELGASEVKVAVLVEKILSRPKPIRADYVGISVPDRYVFGMGMDVYGWWRNLPAIYAMADEK